MKIFILFLLIISSVINTYSQGTLFSYVEEPQLTEDQEELIDQYRNHPQYIDIHFVEIEELSSIEDSGAIKILLPDRESEYVFNARYVDGDTSNYRWYGEVEGHNDSTSNNFGFLTYLSDDKQKFGYFAFDSIQYELHQLGDSVQILIEYYTDRTQCGVQGNSSPFSGSPISYRSCPDLKRIDVLVLWTREGALDNTSGNQLVEEVIQKTVKSSIFFGTIAIRNSGITNNEIYFNLVGVEEVQFTPSTEIGDDLDRITKSQVNQQALDIRALRESYNADLVVVLVEESYTDAAGAAPSAGVLGDGEYAYAIVQRIYAGHNHVFVHELAHLFGCLHQQCSLDLDSCDDNPPAIAHGYQIHTNGFLGIGGKRFKTVMNVSNRITIPYFSNPNVQYKKRAIGVSSTNYNALQLKNEACDVSEYRGESFNSGLLLVGINLSSYDCIISEDREVEAIISGGGPSYTYAWYTSLNGFQYSASLGSSSTQSITIPSGAHGLFVKLVVTSGSQSHTAVTYLRPCSIILDGFKGFYINNTASDTDIISLQIYPNPSQGSENLFVEFDLKSETHGKLELLNLDGKHIMILKEGLFNKGKQAYNIESDISPQVYLLKLSTITNESTIKFIRL